MGILKEKLKTFMKINKETKKAYNIANMFLKNKNINLNNIIKKISIIYDLKKPIINDIKIDNDIEIYLYGNNLKNYNFILRFDIDNYDILYVKPYNKPYIDVYKVLNNVLIHDIKIYNNKNKKELMILSIFNRKDNYIKIINGKKLEGYVFKYRNDYIDVSIHIELPESVAFVANYFVERIFSYNDEIKDIDTLKYIVSTLLNEEDFMIIDNQNKEKSKKKVLKTEE